MFKPVVTTIPWSWSWIRRHHPMIWIGWTLATLLVLPAVFLVHWVMSRTFAATHVAGEWLSGFEFVYLNDWLIAQSAGFSTLVVVLAVLVFLYWLSAVFLSGGIVSAALDRQKPFSASVFFGASATYFFRCLRLSALVTTSCLVALVWLMLGSWGLIGWVATVALLVMVGDVAKAIIVGREGTGAWTAFKSSWLWLPRHAWHVLGVYGAGLAVLLLGFALYNVIDHAITPDSVALIVLTFFLQQMFSILRIAVRIQTMGAVAMVWSLADGENSP